MSLEATITIIMVMMVVMMMVIMGPTELCYKTISIIIITFATAQKRFQMLYPEKIPVLSHFEEPKRNLTKRY
jgi:hypothetical protein